MCSLSARIGGIVSPLILLAVRGHTPTSVCLSLLHSQDKWGASVPMLVMGTVATAAGALSSVLPETMNKPLPETLAELDPLHTRAQK